jgi:hypothetical protein
MSIRIDLPAQEDAPLLTALKKLGAIPFCQSNVPYSLVRLDILEENGRIWRPLNFEKF